MSLKGERCSVPGRADVTRAPLALDGRLLRQSRGSQRRGPCQKRGASAAARDTGASQAPLAIMTYTVPRKGPAGLLVWHMLTRTATC